MRKSKIKKTRQGVTQLLAQSEKLVQLADEITNGLSVSQVADILRISKRTAQRRLARKDLEAVRLRKRGRWEWLDWLADELVHVGPK